jgi:hypothetical protein
MADFVTDYLEMCNIDQSEAPAIYHRWVALSIMGAYLGRSSWINFGIGLIYPNQYIMLMGSPGTRKGSAMGPGKRLLKTVGFGRFSADKTSKERFLMDMKQYDEVVGLEDIENLTMDAPAESYIMSGEFTDFVGQGNMEFITMLTNLWDNLEKYKQPKIAGKSVEVEKPTVNLLGGNTPDGFALAFPPEALGNGFLSRTLLIHADPTANRIAWPEALDELRLHSLANRMLEAKTMMAGQIAVSAAARAVGKEIYEKEIPVDDPRFTHYQQRRFIHLLKIALLLAVYDMKNMVDPVHMVRANTMLVAAERVMPRALGEFGASRHSLVAGKILQHLSHSHMPQTPNDLWKVVSRDLSKMTDMIEILQGLKSADKIQVMRIAAKDGYMAKHTVKREWPAHLLDTDWLTETELF